MNELVCTVCDKPKHALKQKKSRLLPGVPMMICQDCMDAKREPRGFVVLAAREHGLDYVANWIKPQRYVGEPITLREIN